MGLRERVARFMRYRYGTDDLYYFLLIASLVLSVVSAFLRRFPLVYTVLYGLSGLLLIWMLWRAFSKNIDMRRRENQRFLRLCERCKSRFRLAKSRVRECRTHTYRRCKKCKAVLRLPRKRGRHAVKCPCCARHFRLRIFFGSKSGRKYADKM